MGLSYQERKNIKKNRIILEKQENIEIIQNSTGFSRTKKTLTRERLVGEKPRHTIKSSNIRQKKSSNKDISKRDVQKQSLIQQDKLKQSCGSSHEIDLDLQKKQENVLLSLREDKKKPTNKTESKESRETWADRLAGSCVCKERFSLQHQGISISPRYRDDKELLPRPRKRTVDSQVTASNGSWEPGAKGDHKSSLLKEPKNQAKDKHSKDIILKYIKNDFPHITTSQHSINCGYGFLGHCTRMCTCSQPLKGVICRHICPQMPACANREYTYCQNEYYFDWANSQAKVTGQCCKAATDSCKRQCSCQHRNLATQHFCCHSGKQKYESQLCSNADSHSTGNCKDISNNTKESPEQLKEFMESKKRECDKQRESNKKLMKKLEFHNMKEATQRKLFKGEKFGQFLSESEAEELIRCLDRYIDEYECEKDIGLKTIKQNKDDRCSTSTVELNTSQQQPADYKKTWNDEFLASQYSKRTLNMLKKMKIRAYSPRKPHRHKTQENRQNSENEVKTSNHKRVDKIKNYQQYLEKLAKEQIEKSVIKEFEKREGQFFKEIERPRKTEQFYREPKAEHNFQCLRCKDKTVGISFPAQRGSSHMRISPTNKDMPKTAKESETLKEMESMWKYSDLEGRSFKQSDEDFREQLYHQQKLKLLNNETNVESDLQNGKRNTSQVNDFKGHYTEAKAVEIEQSAYRKTTNDFHKTRDSLDLSHSLQSDCPNCVHKFYKSKERRSDVEEYEEGINIPKGSKNQSQYSTKNKLEIDSTCKQKHDPCEEHGRPKELKQERRNFYAIEIPGENRFSECQRKSEAEEQEEYTTKDKLENARREQHDPCDNKSSKEYKQQQNARSRTSSDRIFTKVHGCDHAMEIQNEQRLNESPGPKDNIKFTKFTRQQKQQQYTHKESAKEKRFKEAYDTIQEIIQSARNLKEIETNEANQQEQYLIESSKREKVINKQSQYNDSNNDTVYDHNLASEFEEEHCAVAESSERNRKAYKHWQYIEKESNDDKNDKPFQISRVDHQTLKEFNRLRQETLNESQDCEPKTINEVKQSLLQLSESLKETRLSDCHKSEQFANESQRKNICGECQVTDGPKDPKDTQSTVLKQRQYSANDFLTETSLCDTQDRYDFKSSPSSRTIRFNECQDNDPNYTRYNKISPKLGPIQCPNNENTREKQFSEAQEPITNAKEIKCGKKEERRLHKAKAENCYETETTISNLSEIKNVLRLKDPKSKATLHHKCEETRKVVKEAESPSRCKHVSDGRPKRASEVEQSYDNYPAEFKAKTEEEISLPKYNSDLLFAVKEETLSFSRSIETTTQIKLGEAKNHYDRELEAGKEEDLTQQYFHSDNYTQEFSQPLQSPKETKLTTNTNQNYYGQSPRDLRTEEEKEDKILHSLDLEWLTEIEASLMFAKRKCAAEKSSRETTLKSAEKDSDYQDFSRAAQTDIDDASWQVRESNLGRSIEVHRNAQNPHQPQMQSGEIFDKTWERTNAPLQPVKKLNKVHFKCPESNRKQSNRYMESPQQRETEIHPDQKPIDKVVEQDLQAIDAVKQAKPPGEHDDLSARSYSSDYSAFRKLMDYNLGIVSHRISHTDSNLANELKEQISQQTYVKEIETNQKEFLPLKTCLKKANTAAEDLISKCSSCKSFETNHSFVKKESSPDQAAETLESQTVQDVQFKDLEETFPDPSDAQLKPAARDEDNFSNSKTNEIHQRYQQSKEKISQDSLPLSEKDIPPVPALYLIQDLEVEDLNEELPSNAYLEQESYESKTPRNAKQWISKDTYKRYQAIKGNISKDSLPSSQKSIPQILALNLTEDLQIKADEELPANPCLAESSYQLDTRQDVKKQWQAKDVYQRCQDSNTNFSASSNISGNNRQQTCKPKSSTVSQASGRSSVFDTDPVPLKGILKSCRLLENPHAGSYDLPAYNTNSVVSGREQDLFSRQLETSRSNSTAETRKEISGREISDETDEAVKTNSQRPITLELDYKLNDIHSVNHQQAMCPDCQLETEAELENYDFTSCTVPMPAFRQCPCMWDTYVEMMLNYYRGRKSY